MDALNQAKSNSHSKQSHIGDAASELLNEGKKFANELYEDGINQVDKAKKEAEVYTDELLEQVRANPLKAILIAGGVGFLLSALLKK